MPLDSSQVGTEFARSRVVCDERWLMSYAAGVPDESPSLYDTVGSLEVHPMFPVGPEWDLLLMQRASTTGLSADEARRGVHAAHDVILHRPIRRGEEVSLVGRHVGVGTTRAGAVQHSLVEATGGDGQPAWSSWYTSVMRGVALRGEPAMAALPWPAAPVRAAPVRAAPVPAAVPVAPLASREWPVTRSDPHRYTECAHIWNPIHTDAAVARAAGLADPILHGTATLARGVSTCLEVAGRRHGEVGRVRGRFAAMVPLDSVMRVEVLEVGPAAVFFVVRNGAGELAVRDGSVSFSAAGSRG